MEEPLKTRKGKIAALPLVIRTELNHRLLNGQLGPQVLPWLNGLPDVMVIMSDRFEGEEINPQNLSDWRKGGFRDWLKSNERIQHTKELAKYSAELAKSNGGRLAEGAQAIAAGRILSVLEEVGGTMDVESLEKLVGALTNLRKTEIGQQRADQGRVVLSQNDERLKLDREKFEMLVCGKLLDAAKLQRAREISESSMNNDEKIKALRQTYFADVDALEASGTVKLPEN